MFLVSVSLCSCDEKKAIIGQVAEDLSVYSTPYTKCEKNADGTYSFYVYAAPTQFQEKETYYEKDLSIVESDDKNFFFMNKASNIKTYYPTRITEDFLITDEQGDIRFHLVGNVDEFAQGEKTKFENIYGDVVSAVRYQTTNGMELYCYSTISGIQMEYICTDNKDIPSVTIDTDVTSVSDQNNGYIVLNNNLEKSVVIYTPIVRAQEGEELNFDSRLKCKKKAGEYRLTVQQAKSIEKSDIRLTFSIERYVNKMPDSTMYSIKNQNTFISNYAIVGENNEFGEGMHYMRFRLQYYFTMDPNNVIKAQYYVKNLGGKCKDKNLQLYQCLEQWSSTKMLWETRPQSGKKSFSYGNCISDNWVVFDISDFVKECFMDTTWNLESLGTVMRCDDGDFVMATSDNSLYVPYVKIVMKELPDEFSNETNINPPVKTQVDIDKY